jgi:hypothetical protein
MLSENFPAIVANATTSLTVLGRRLAVCSVAFDLSDDLGRLPFRFGHSPIGRIVEPPRPPAIVLLDARTLRGVDGLAADRNRGSGDRDPLDLANRLAGWWVVCREADRADPPRPAGPYLGNSRCSSCVELRI